MSGINIVTQSFSVKGTLFASTLTTSTIKLLDQDSGDFNNNITIKNGVLQVNNAPVGGQVGADLVVSTLTYGGPKNDFLFAPQSAIEEQFFLYNGETEPIPFIVPFGVRELEVKLVGAGGAVSAKSGIAQGGNGAFVTAKVAVQPGELLELVVGQGGKSANNENAVGGGGYGFLASLGGAGGGGRSALLRNGIDILTAGGGGGSIGTSTGGNAWVPITENPDPAPPPDANGTGKDGLPTGCGGAGQVTAGGASGGNGESGKHFRGGDADGVDQGVQQSGAGGGGGAYGGGSSGPIDNDTGGGAGGGASYVLDKSVTAELEYCYNGSDRSRYVDDPDFILAGDTTIGMGGSASSPQDGGNGLAVIRYVSAEINLKTNISSAVISYQFPNNSYQVSGASVFSKKHKQVFTYNGGDGTDGSIQHFSIPAGVTEVFVKVWGAGGSGNGGNGAFISGLLNVAGISDLDIIVGGPGNITTGIGGGYGGGGGGYPGASTAGGGCSAIITQKQDNTIDTYYAVSAGGGGSSYSPGGNGGILRGGLPSNPYYPGQMTPATQTEGGQSSTQYAADGVKLDIINNVIVSGGGESPGGADNNAGGGGGGGYYGGAQGAENLNIGARDGGGGGSSYVDKLTNLLAYGGADVNLYMKDPDYLVDSTSSFYKSGAGLANNAGLVVIEWGSSTNFVVRSSDESSIIQHNTSTIFNTVNFQGFNTNFSVFSKTNNIKTVAYDYTGKNQTFVVPTGITRIHLQLWGAGGGFYGNGAYIEGDMDVVPGQELVVIVGGAGEPPTPAGGFGGYGGGGNGKIGAGGGGGRTAINNGLDMVTAAGGGCGGPGASGQVCHAGIYDGYKGEGLLGGEGGHYGNGGDPANNSGKATAGYEYSGGNGGITNAGQAVLGGQYTDGGAIWYSNTINDNEPTFAKVAPDAFVGGQILSIKYNGTAYVATGTSPTDGRLVAYSTDGQTWLKAQTAFPPGYVFDPTQPIPPNAPMGSGVGSGRALLYENGKWWVGGDFGVSGLLLYTSTDGIVWSGVPVNNLLFGGGGIYSLARNSSYYLAGTLGSDGFGPAGSTEPQHYPILYSPDGYTWTPAAGDDLFTNQSCVNTFLIVKDNDGNDTTTVLAGCLQIDQPIKKTKIAFSNDNGMTWGNFTASTIFDTTCTTLAQYTGWKDSATNTLILAGGDGTSSFAQYTGSSWERLDPKLNITIVTNITFVEQSNPDLGYFIISGKVTDQNVSYKFPTHIVDGVLKLNMDSNARIQIGDLSTGSTNFINSGAVTGLVGGGGGGSGHYGGAGADGLSGGGGGASYLGQLINPIYYDGTMTNTYQMASGYKPGVGLGGTLNGTAYSGAGNGYAIISYELADLYFTSDNADSKVQFGHIVASSTIVDELKLRNSQGEFNIYSSVSSKTVFTAIGEDQFYEVPKGVTSVRVRMWGGGGAGGYAPANAGGNGAFVSGVLDVVPGETLKVVVGKGGKPGTIEESQVWQEGLNANTGFTMRNIVSIACTTDASPVKPSWYTLQNWNNLTTKRILYALVNNDIDGGIYGGVEQNVDSTDTSQSSIWWTKLSGTTNELQEIKTKWQKVVCSVDGTIVVVIARGVSITGLWYSTNSGSTWASNAMTSQPDNWYDVAVYDSKVVAVPKDPTSNAGQIYYTNNINTSSMTTLPQYGSAGGGSDGNAARNWTSIALSNTDDTIWAVDNGGYRACSIVASTGQINTLPIPPAGAYTQKVLISVYGSLSVVGGYTYGPGSSGLYVSTDSGVTFTEVPTTSLPETYWFSIQTYSIPDSSYNYIVASGSSGTYFFTNTPFSNGWTYTQLGFGTGCLALGYVTEVQEDSVTSNFLSRVYSFSASINGNVVYSYLITKPPDNRPIGKVYGDGNTVIDGAGFLGGGRSAIIRAQDELATAGAGGASGPGTIVSYGGHGGIYKSKSGSDAGFGSVPGGSATQQQGGPPGNPGYSYAATAGIQYESGDGSWNNRGGSITDYGGSGGGGYYGGGGGSAFSAGGGGSSYIDNIKNEYSLGGDDANKYPTIQDYDPLSRIALGGDDSTGYKGGDGLVVIEVITDLVLAPTNAAAKVTIQGPDITDFGFISLHNTSLTIKDTIQWSPDGSNWFPIQSGGFGHSNNSGVFKSGTGWEAVYNGSMWMAVGEHNGSGDTDYNNNVSTPLTSIQYSKDGLNWLPAVSGLGFKTGYGVTYGKSNWAAAGESVGPNGGTSTLQWSSDGSNWQMARTGGFQVGYAVSYNGTSWVAGGKAYDNKESLQYSTDGIFWSPAIGSFNHEANDMFGTSKGWVAVGSWDTTVDPTNTILYSPDSISWFPSLTGGFSNGTAIEEDGGGEAVYGNDTMIIAVGYGFSRNTSIQYSLDQGRNWNPIVRGGFASSDGNGNAQYYCGGITFNGKLWVATGIDSDVYKLIQWSSDGSNWYGANELVDPDTIIYATTVSYGNITHPDERVTQMTSGFLKAETLYGSNVQGDTVSTSVGMIDVLSNAKQYTSSAIVNQFTTGTFTTYSEVSHLVTDSVYTIVAGGTDVSNSNSIQYSLDGQKWNNIFGDGENTYGFTSIKKGYNTSVTNTLDIQASLYKFSEVKGIAYCAASNTWLAIGLYYNEDGTLNTQNCVQKSSDGINWSTITDHILDIGFIQSTNSLACVDTGSGGTPNYKWVVLCNKCDDNVLSIAGVGNENYTWTNKSIDTNSVSSAYKLTYYCSGSTLSVSTFIIGTDDYIYGTDDFTTFYKHNNSIKNTTDLLVIDTHIDPTEWIVATTGYDNGVAKVSYSMDVRMLKIWDTKDIKNMYSGPVNIAFSSTINGKNDGTLIFVGNSTTLEYSIQYSKVNNLSIIPTPALTGGFQYDFKSTIGTTNTIYRGNTIIYDPLNHQFVAGGLTNDSKTSIQYSTDGSNWSPITSGGFNGYLLDPVVDTDTSIVSATNYQLKPFGEPLIQAGSFSGTPANDVTITFPKPFRNPPVVVATPSNSTTETISVFNITPTEFHCNCNGNFTWIATPSST